MSLSSSLNSHYEKFLATGEVKCIDEDIPFEIPEGWEWCRLSSVSIIQEGPGIRSYQYKLSGIQLLTVTNILEGSIDLDKSRKYISEKEYEAKYMHFQLNKGDIICACSGGSWGKSALVEFQDIKIILNTSTLRLRFFNDKADNQFLYHLTKSDFFKLQLQNQLSGIQPNFGYAHYSKILMPLPPLKEQHRIVSKIEELLPFLNLYESSQNKLDTLNQEIIIRLKKSILQEAIQGRLVPQDPSDEPVSELLKRIREEKQRLVKEGKLKKKDITDSVIFKGDDNRHYEKIGGQIIDISEDIPFDIPDSWQWTRLGYIANMFTGNSISDTEKRTKYTYVNGMEYIGTKDVGFDNRINYCNGISIPSDYLSEFKIAPENSILMCIEGGSAGKKIALTSQKVCFGNKLCCVDPYADTLVKFVYFYLQTPSFFAFFFGNITGIIGGVSVNNLKKILIPIPPIKEQARMIKQLEQLFKQLH